MAGKIYADGILTSDFCQRNEFRYNRNHRRFIATAFAPLAQLDRASGYEPEGRKFESSRAHHSKTHPTLDLRRFRGLIGSIICDNKKARREGTLSRPFGGVISGTVLWLILPANKNSILLRNKKRCNNQTRIS